MKLARAKLCLDCEEVYEGVECPKCTAKEYMYVCKWVRLLRTIVEEEDEDRTKAV